MGSNTHNHTNKERSFAGAIKFFVLVLVWAALLSCTQAAPSIVGAKRLPPTKIPGARHSKHEIILQLNTTLEVIGNITQNMKIVLNNLQNGTGRRLFEMQKCNKHFSKKTMVSVINLFIVSGD